MATADGDDNAYSWETGYAEGLNIRDVLQEDETGSIERSVSGLVHEAKRKRRVHDRPARVRLGIMRHVYLIIDCSNAMTDKDLMPSRISVTVRTLTEFLDKFFEHNPISQLGIIVCRDKKAERLVSLTGNARKHREALVLLNEAYCSGEFSLQNALTMAMNNLQDIPTHTSREILIIMGSLASCDPANITATIEVLKRHGIRCSVIGLAAEVFVCRRVCNETHGTYNVIVDDCHLLNLLLDQTSPPIARKTDESNVVKMGFPLHKRTHIPSLCICHSNDRTKRFATDGGYFCPQCGAKYCTIPVECRLCRLTLVAAPQLARAYQHLLPLASFDEMDAPGDSTCYGCDKRLDTGAGAKCYRCSCCTNCFCIDCDLLLHESLQVCPGCCR